VFHDVAPPIRHRRPHRGRRLAVSAASLVAAVSVGLLVAVHGGASSPAEHWSVHRGDTLWAIAQSRYPGGDVQSRIGEIEALNHLDGPELSPGQILTLPAP
jgi:nucleoid-associated protein YgaU